MRRALAPPGHPSRACRAAVLLALATATLPVALAAPDEPGAAFRERLRLRLEAAAQGAALEVGDRALLARRTLLEFYARRGDAPAWLDAGGRATPALDELVAAVSGATAEGLDPSDYHAARLARRLAALRAPTRTREAGALVDLELLATDAFLLYGSHCLAGHLDPEAIDPEWVAARRGADLAAVLQSALDGGRVGAALRGLLPPQPGYARLREWLARMREAAAGEGWPTVPDGPKLELGSEGGAVDALRARLAATDDASLAEAPAGTPVDEPLERAVRAFQARHGLEADGVVGPATRRALNVSAEDRAEQIVVNMERWRWLPQELGERHVLVNIAGFHLDLVSSGRPELTMKIIVGRTYRRTPVFSGSMTYLVLNPSWEVPHKLATADILPQIRKDPGYIDSMGFAVLRGWGAGEQRIDPASVDWSSMKPAGFPYRLRQRPGPKNALGRVKFMFPNRFNVYLHDTPGRELFARASRTFSSGCIRLERPIELAERLLAEDPGWTPPAIAAALERGAERTVTLPRPVPVHLLYWTAFVDEAGALQLREDVYGRDARVLVALREPKPESASTLEE